MSLHDTLQCHYPLPDPEFQKEVFQTRDLGDTRSHYLITAEGRLWRLRRADAFTKDSPLPNPPDKAEGVHYHGDFGFHADTAKGRIEYRVRFTHGVVEWIRREAEEAPPYVDTLDVLIRDARELEQERRTRLVAFFDRLESRDAAVARQALETFGDRARAASWLGRALRQFDNQNSFEMLAQGQRREVLEALTQIDYGFFA